MNIHIPGMINRDFWMHQLSQPRLIDINNQTGAFRKLMEV